MAQHDPKAKEPVEDFPIRFVWQENEWLAIFDEQIKLLREDIARARAEDRLIVYLSCPISKRGGGYHATNVEIAQYTCNSLQDKWGSRFWILNPTQYQLESKEGRGLIHQHAERLGISFGTLRNLPRPGGGDYMRMWTKVLVEDQEHNLGGNFDVFYFLGPSDVHQFMSRGGSVSLTEGIEEYFSRKFTMDPDFRDGFSDAEIIWDRAWEDDDNVARRNEQLERRDAWEQRRVAFFRFYGVRASANFSKGCHDEWNIFCEINRRRFSQSGGDVGELLAGYFDDRQIDPGAAVTPVDHGYAATE